ncbi:MAG TPA: M23 family metallopeptidase [Pseudobacteroides sp.]|uniref:M23 family metallopeptidase n=1 Tax=Pseudobacteroides sp. TaxID=1968840 RepID=UPI002F93BFC3
MDNTTARGTYQRRSTYNRKKKKNSENSKLTFTIFKQLIISFLIFLLVSIAMSFDTPITDFLADKVSYVMEYDVKMDDIFGKINSFTDMLKKNTIQKESQGEGSNDQKDQDAIDISSTEEDSVPASAPIYPFEYDDSSKIDYGGIIEEYELDIQEEKKPNTAEGNNQDGNTEKSLPKVNEKSSIKNTNKTNVKFMVPASGPLGSEFGDRIHPIKGKVEMHKGIDIKANHGVAIKAAMAGKVIEAGPNSSFGNMVKIDHQNGYITLYAHCSVIVTKKGNMVKQGEIISKVGSTGTSTGPHLHFEIWKNGTPVNPLDYVKIG